MLQFESAQEPVRPTAVNVRATIQLWIPNKQRDPEEYEDDANPR